MSAVMELPTPTDVSSLRAALGLFSYYRKFFNRFSTIAFPLNRLLKKEALWGWSDPQQQAFAELKEHLCLAPVVQLPDSYKPFILTTDWSHRGMGAVLSQLDQEGVKHPICYAFRSCNPSKQNYNSFDGECLAVVWATNLFKPYLFDHSSTLVTDHEPLKWIMTTQRLTGKLARWSLVLQEYDFTVIHRAGTNKANADCLSRYPGTSTDSWERGEVLPAQPTRPRGSGTPYLLRIPILQPR